MWYAFAVAGLLIGSIGIVTTIGALMPRQHQASGSAEFATNADSLWELAVALQEESDVKTEAVIEERPRRRVTRVIEPPGAMFGGTWTLEFESIASGTRLTITEEGHVYNPLFRFLGKYVFGQDTTLRTFLKTLGNRVQG